MKRKIIISVLSVLLIGCSKQNGGLPIELVPIETKTQLIFPEKNSECTSGRIISLIQSEVTFRWTPVEIADKYQVKLVNLIDASTELFEATNNTINLTLLRGTPYSWSVTTMLMNSNEQVESDIQSFYNAAATGEFAYVPFPALSVAPENGASRTLVTNSMTLQWEASDLDGDILNFDVYFGRDPTPGLYAQEILTTQLEVSEVILGNTYYWQIVTRDAQGNESISEVFTFEVID